MIRISNAICSKHIKYREEYSKLEHVKEKPFILCIAPFEQPYSFAQSDNAIRKVLYKYNAPLYVKNEQSGNVHIVGEEYVDNVIKDNGTEIELGFFTDDRMKEISAIIFSSTATATKSQALNSDKYPNTIFSACRYNINSWDKPNVIVQREGDYKETLIDGLHVFLNPFASTPIDPKIFYDEDITYHDYNIEKKEAITIANDGILISHSCFTLRHVTSLENADKKINTEMEHDFLKKVPEWKEDTLYRLNANVGQGVNNHIAHYNGWTIIVFQDSVDKDWAFIAKPITVFTMQEFILYTIESIGIDIFYDSMDEAYIKAKQEIDNTIA